MTLDGNDQSGPERKGARGIRFSLFALLVFVTVLSLLLAWWKFVYLHEQHLVATRDLLAKRVSELEEEVYRKTEEYIDISRELGREGDSENVLLEQDVKRLDRVDAELMRLEGREAELPTNDSSGIRTSLEKRIASLRKQQQELEKTIRQRSEQSADLELRKRDIQRLQRIADELSLELEHAELEVKKRGL
jgi:myosin heavy subunit